MEVSEFCSRAPVVIVAGKGGAGKSTVSATLAHLAASHGLKALLVDLESRPELTSGFDHEQLLSYEAVTLFSKGAGRVDGRLVTSELALVEYFNDHGMGRLGRSLQRTGLLEIVATAIPGLRELLILGKVKQLEAAGSYDLIVVDAPATGHAITLLTSAAGMQDAASSGPLRQQANEVAAMLADPRRSQLAAFSVEDKAGIRLGPVIVNGLYPDIAALAIPAEMAAKDAGVSISASGLAQLEQARLLQSSRLQRQKLEQDRIKAQLPLPSIALPRILGSQIDLEGLTELSEAMAEAISSMKPEL
ncbi:MAG: AAA family ATPase [Actinobacteria bacterium]|nr:AAA family ATPase [Actinomycetota bacterium]